MIKLENVSKIFNQGHVKAVDDVSFCIESGNIGCIIGSSGCGKTTTLKMINRLIEPSSGKIWVGDCQSHEMDAISWRRSIGYVIQKAGLFPHLTVAQNISLLGKIKKRKKADLKKRVEYLLNMIDMPYAEYADRYPYELSGGQQQRVGIARALMEDPPILLMDEPFGALDPITRNSLHEELLQLNKRLNKTILIVTHDMEEAFKLGDTVILMNAGSVVQAGTKQELVDRPVNQFVSEFLKGISSDS